MSDTGGTTHDDETPAVEAIIFDWAGTITPPLFEVLRDSAVAVGLSPEDLAAAALQLGGYFTDEDSIFHQAERGEVDDDALRQALEEIVPGAGQIFDTGPGSLFHAPDRPEMVELLDELAESDVLVVLATNNFATGHEILATRYLDTGLVSAVVNSALVGVRKPDPRFYQLILETFDLDPAMVLVVDDSEANLIAAGGLGCATVLVSSDTARAVATIKAFI